jgi:hypothetical protein
LSELLEGEPGRTETETGGSRAQPDCHKKVARSSLWIKKIDLISCALGINPREYLEDVFRRLMGHNAKKLEELLPDRWLLGRKSQKSSE